MQQQLGKREAETDESLAARAQAVLHGKDDLLGSVQAKLLLKLCHGVWIHKLASGIHAC